MTERDPRTDPRPGDVLKGMFVTLTVINVDEDGRVSFDFDSGGLGRRPLKTWRAWAKFATVLTRVQEP